MGMKSVKLLCFMFSLAFLDLTVHNIQFWKGNQASESSEKKIGAPVVRFELTTLRVVDCTLQPPIEKFHSFLQSESLQKKIIQDCARSDSSQYKRQHYFLFISYSWRISTNYDLYMGLCQSVVKRET